jgi:hypothetical protein
MRLSLSEVFFTSDSRRKLFGKRRGEEHPAERQLHAYAKVSDRQGVVQSGFSLVIEKWLIGQGL